MQYPYDTAEKYNSSTNQKSLKFQWFVRLGATKCHPLQDGTLGILVELRGIEPLSESNLTGTSPGADGHLHFLTAAGIVTLCGLVAS